MLLLSVVAVMATIMAASAMPAFAMPSGFVLSCQDEKGNIFESSTGAPKGKLGNKSFGQANSKAAQEGFRGNECQRGPVR